MAFQIEVDSKNIEWEKKTFAPHWNICLIQILLAVAAPEQWRGASAPGRDTRDQSDGQNPAFVPRTEY